MSELVEQVAMALCQNALGGKRCPCAEGCAFRCADAYPGQQARAALSVLEPRIEALEREQGWQDIATAPKDGGEGLVGCWVYADAKRRTRRWSSWQTIFDGGPLGCDGEWGDEPTHWRPLPEPPAIRSGDAV